MSPALMAAFSDREMEKFSELIDAYTTDRSLGDIDEISDVSHSRRRPKSSSITKLYRARIMWTPNNS